MSEIVGLQLEECVGKIFNFGFGNIFKILSFTNSRKSFTIQTEFGTFKRKIFYNRGNCNCIYQEGRYCYLYNTYLIENIYTDIDTTTYYINNNTDTNNDNECVAEYIG